MQEKVCKYCGKLCKNNNSLIQHEIRCKMNPNRLEKSPNYRNGMLGKRSKRKGMKAENCEEIRRQMETFKKNKLLGLHKDTSGVNNNMYKYPEARKKISKTCLEKSKLGEWHTSLAKGHHYNYRGEDLHCKWELAYAKWLDSRNISWERPHSRFLYSYQGKNHYYTPDFYLPETDEYIEVKGYVTGKDYAKWKQFPEDKKLVVIKRKQLDELGIKIT